ncbi:hypothetical protein LDDCCGHA_5588 [Methylobacterium oxalidis]|nr:hypothetical protein LDDCCGHA_5588 [Methylobacterium oxalidis]
MTAGTLGPAHRPAWERRWAPRTWLARLSRLSSALAAPGLRLWVAIAAVVALDAAWLALLRVEVEPAGFASCAGLVCALLLAAAYCGTVRPEPTLRGMALASACLIAVTVPAAILHYLAATLAFPLVDASLARAEAALGFDWPAYLGVLAEHPVLARGLALAYHSSGPQVALVVIALSATRRLGRLWRFVRLFAGTLLVVIAVSAVLPAQGPYAFYAPERVPAGHIETVGALWHLEPLERLRSGALRSLALGDIRALVTFPSFHVCLAILTAWALAPLRLIGPAAVALNGAVIVGTVGAGGHYLPDILAGAALACLALAVSRRRLGSAPALSPASSDGASMQRR